MYRTLFKLWHGIIAFVMVGMLSTVWLRKTFLSKKENGALIVDKLNDLGVHIELKDAIDIATAIREPMWNWHIYLGYALAFLVVYRGLLYLFDKRDKMSFAEADLHKKGVRVLYMLFYVSLVFITISGLLYHFYQDLAIAKDTALGIKKFHKLWYNYFLYFVPLHIVAIIAADIIHKDGIPSSITRPKKG
ncbi:MAG: cytochrome b/b6 domain-containing protein [Sulfurimonas sp.]|jgi:cytochrome b561|nr:cytochrome b/b6 domain-containing protein [Sulfurimonadaceae bacterium]